MQCLRLQQKHDVELAQLRRELEERTHALEAAEERLADMHEDHGANLLEKSRALESLRSTLAEQPTHHDEDDVDGQFEDFSHSMVSAVEQLEGEAGVEQGTDGELLATQLAVLRELVARKLAAKQTEVAAAVDKCVAAQEI